MPSTPAHNAPPDDGRNEPGLGATYGPETPWLLVVNWNKAQKYKEANPPWIILYTSLRKHGTQTANGKGWVTLSDASRSALINLWLLAAEQTDDGLLWGDPAFLARKMPLNGPLDMAELLEAGFVRYVDDAMAEKVRAEAAEKRQPKKQTRTAKTAAETTAPTSQAREEEAAAWLAKTPNMRAADLATQLGCSIRTVYKLRAWRQRPSIATATAKTEESRGEERQSKGEDTTGSSASVRAPLPSAQSLRVMGQQAQTEQSKAKPVTTGQDKPETTAKPQAETPASGKPAEPASPKEPEAEGAKKKRRHRRRSRPPRASLRRGPTIVGSTLKLYWQDPDAVAFGETVFETLWPNRSTDSDDAQSEIGAFTKLFFKRIRTKVPTLELPHFRLKAIERAKHIAKYGKSADSRGAVFTSIVYDMLGVPARASPAC